MQQQQRYYHRGIGFIPAKTSSWIEKGRNGFYLGMILSIVIALGSLFVWGIYFQWSIHEGNDTTAEKDTVGYQQDHIFHRNQDNGCISVQVIPHRCEIDGKRKVLRLLPRSDIHEIVLFPEFADIQDEKLCHSPDQRMIVFLSPKHIYEVYQAKWFNESFSNVTFQYERNQFDGFFPLSEKSFVWSHIRNIHSVLFFPDRLIWRERQRYDSKSSPPPRLSYIHEQSSLSIWFDEETMMYKPKMEIILRSQSLESQWRPFFFLLVILATIFRSTCPSSRFFQGILLVESVILFVIYFPSFDNGEGWSLTIGVCKIIWFFILWSNICYSYYLFLVQSPPRIHSPVFEPSSETIEGESEDNDNHHGGGEYLLLQYLIYWIGYRKENLLFGLLLSLFFYYMSIYQMNPVEYHTHRRRYLYANICTGLCGFQSFLLYFIPWMGYEYTYPSELVSVRWFFVFYIACSVIAWRKQQQHGKTTGGVKKNNNKFIRD